MFVVYGSVVISSTDHGDYSIFWLKLKRLLRIVYYTCQLLVYSDKTIHWGCKQSASFSVGYFKHWHLLWHLLIIYIWTPMFLSASSKVRVRDIGIALTDQLFSCQTIWQQLHFCSLFEINRGSQHSHTLAYFLLATVRRIFLMSYIQHSL